jgi:hypothetical protein
METAGSGSSGEREPLAGLVERVTFHSADSGFCVLRIKARGHRDLVTVLGAAPSIAAGEYIQASGTWENHREHGVQFRSGVPYSLIRHFIARSPLRDLTGHCGGLKRETVRVSEADEFAPRVSERVDYETRRKGP